ncbi:MAG: RNA polymerase sigma factor [Planctomycetota bacterium]|nr:RNA polymerase sigma factor [Planctomycetota bacterium]
MPDISVGGLGSTSRDSNHAARVRALYVQFHDRVLAFARKLAQPAVAEDIAQEVFVRLMNNPGLTDRDISVSYLLKIADNLAKRRYRSSRRFEPLGPATQDDDRFFADVENRRGRSGFHSIPGRESNDEADQKLAALGALTAAEHEAVRLIVCEGLSYEAAANALAVQVSTVNNWKFRGIQRLRAS